MSDISKARDFAKEKHDGQKRNDGKPYYYGHLVPVSIIAAMIARQYQCSNKEIEQVEIVGLLHDALEDTITEHSEIIHNFGVHVYNAVCILTKREDSYISYIMKIVDSNNKLAMIVKMADLQHNSSDLTTGSTRKDKYELAHAIILRAYNEEFNS